MIKPKFNLKKKDSKGYSLILLRVYYKNEEFLYSTGYRIKSKQWDKETQRAIVKGLPKENATQNDFINAQLDKMSGRIKEIFQLFEIEGIVPDNRLLKERMNKEFRKKADLNSLTLLEYVDRLIKKSKNGTRLNKDGTRIKQNTIKGYTTTYNHLKNYIKNKNKLIGGVNRAFYDGFVRYFNDSKYNDDNNYSTNTKGKNLKNLKVFIKAARDEGIKVDDFIDNKDFIVPEEETDTIYLNSSELTKLYNLDLSDKPHYERVRDLFLIGAHTGLRWGDLIKLKSEHFIHKEDGSFIKIRTEKTNKPIYIPLKPIVQEIINKYKHGIPKPMPNQKANEYVKKICKKAKINNTETISITRGGFRRDETKPKYELVSTHTARRSFATNAKLAGLDAHEIMKFTGHTTERSFLKYIRMTPEDNAHKLVNHEFFQEGSLKVVK